MIGKLRGVIDTSLFSLPPCGGGPGWGVRKARCASCFTPHPALRADLPRKGGGKESGT
jgi:hypothetical protein